MEEKRVHEVFQLSVLGKAGFALVECLSGLALWLVGSDTISNFVKKLAQHELVEDPHDFIASHLLSWAQTFSVDTQHFYAFYLFAHGIIKLFLMIEVLRNRLWAYPAAIIVMSLFIAYQIYRISYSHSLGLIALTIFDIIVTALIWYEYHLIRKNRTAH